MSEQENDVCFIIVSYVTSMYRNIREMMFSYRYYAVRSSNCFSVPIVSSVFVYEVSPPSDGKFRDAC